MTSSSMINTKNSNKRYVKHILAVTFAITSLISCFLTCVQYRFNEYVYNVSVWKFIVSSGFKVESRYIYVPIIARASLFLTILSLILGLVMIFLRKFRIASVAFLLSSLSPVVLLFVTPVISKYALSEDISKFSVVYFIPIFLILLCSICSSIFSRWILGIEILGESIFKVLSSVSIGAVGIISCYILISGLPAILNIGLFKFLLGTEWKPSESTFGILPLILSSICATIGTIIIGVPIGVMTAVFLSESLNPRIASFVRFGIQILAGIPSVIYGFFGMLVIVPWIRNMFNGKIIGDSLLASILILSIMVLPTIVSVSENALRSVPSSYREAALALGTTPTKTIFKITIPAAKSGIISSVILGIGRAIGETMAVIMVSGNVVNMPKLLSPVRFLTTGIVLEMSYSSGLHRQALFAIGLILFIFIMIINVTFIYIADKGESR